MRLRILVTLFLLPLLLRGQHTAPFERFVAGELDLVGSYFFFGCRRQSRGDLALWATGALSF